MQSLRRSKKHRFQHWRTRNDSTNVANALHPLDFAERGESPTLCRSNQGYQCYCRKSPVRSKFDLKPKTTPVVCYSDSSKLNQVHVIKYSSSAEEDFNKARIAVPSNRIDEDDSQRKNWRCDSPKLVYEDDADDAEVGEDAVEPVPFQNEDIEKKLKELNTFRKENYFDCHSTENLCDQIPDHKCLHKFVLNNRLIPEPLNSDPFGTSRCVHCDQPIQKESHAAKDKGNYQSNVLKKRHKESACVNSISLANDKDITEIEIPKNFNKFAELFESTVGNLKQIRPFNSVALRHQKGVILI